MTRTTIAGRIADWGLGLKFKDLPADAVHEAKRRLIDSFACALGAFDSPPVKAALLMTPRPNERCAADIFGERSSTTPDFAAFVNGIMVRYLDYNDTYLSREPAHPSDNIPALLAAAQAGKRTVEELITAIVAAYEVQCRLCDAASLRVKGWDHVTYGAFSATLGASMLLGLDRDETVHALGIAGVAGPALRQTRAGELSMWKGCAFANAARNAVFAALLAKSGVTGPAPVFEGEFGFQRVVSGPFELEEFAAPAKGRFKILDTCIKYYPAEYHSQSAIGAAVELSGMIEDTDSIESVTVRTFGAAYEIIGSGPERWRPRTRETADHSLAYCVAAALMDKTVTMASFSDERLADERLSALVDRIRVVKDPELDRLYPEAVPNRVEVTTKSGDLISREMIYPKGHPKNPLGDIELDEKFKRLGQWLFAGREAESALDMLWNAEELKDAGRLLGIFRRG